MAVMYRIVVKVFSSPDWQFVGVIFLCRQDFYLIWGSAVSTVKDSYGTKRKARPTRQYGSFNRLRKRVVARCVSMLIAIWESNHGVTFIFRFLIINSGEQFEK